MSRAPEPSSSSSQYRQEQIDYTTITRAEKRNAIEEKLSDLRIEYQYHIEDSEVDMIYETLILYQGKDNYFYNVLRQENGSEKFHKLLFCGASCYYEEGSKKYRPTLHDENLGSIRMTTELPGFFIGRDLKEIMNLIRSSSDRGFSYRFDLDLLENTLEKIIPFLHNGRFHQNRISQGKIDSRIASVRKKTLKKAKASAAEEETSSASAASATPELVSPSSSHPVQNPDQRDLEIENLRQQLTQKDRSLSDLSQENERLSREIGQLLAQNQQERADFQEFKLAAMISQESLQEEKRRLELEKEKQKSQLAEAKARINYLANRLEYLERQKEEYFRKEQDLKEQIRRFDEISDNLACISDGKIPEGDLTSSVVELARQKQDLENTLKWVSEDLYKNKDENDKLRQEIRQIKLKWGEDLRFFGQKMNELMPLVTEKGRKRDHGSLDNDIVFGDSPLEKTHKKPREREEQGVRRGDPSSRPKSPESDGSIRLELSPDLNIRSK